MFEEWVMADQKSREAMAGVDNARIAWEKATADRERSGLNPDDYEATRDVHIESVAKLNAATARAESSRHLERFQWLRYANSAHKELIGTLNEIRGAVNQNSRMYNEGRLKDASILCEIRDLLTKMANPVTMVSLESTPESRAAMRAEKLAEMEEGCSVTAGSLDDDTFYRKVEEMKAHHGGTPVNDGSEAARLSGVLNQEFLAASADAGLYLRLLRRVIRMSALTVETCPAGYPDVAEFLRDEAGRT